MDIEQMKKDLGGGNVFPIGCLLYTSDAADEL